jgi:hypothetical protein
MCTAQQQNSNRRVAMKRLSLVTVYILFLSLSSSSSSVAMDNKDCKTSWPELQGKSKEDAEKVIHQEEPSLTIQVLPKDSMMTMDYRTDRVRVMVDEDGKVAVTPRVG